MPDCPAVPPKSKASSTSSFKKTWPVSLPETLSSASSDSFTRTALNSSALDAVCSPTIILAFPSIGLTGKIIEPPRSLKRANPIFTLSRVVNRSFIASFNTVIRAVLLLAPASRAFMLPDVSNIKSTLGCVSEASVVPVPMYISVSSARPLLLAKTNIAAIKQ